MCAILSLLLAGLRKLSVPQILFARHKSFCLKVKDKMIRIVSTCCNFQNIFQLDKMQQKQKNQRAETLTRLSYSRKKDKRSETICKMNRLQDFSLRRIPFKFFSKGQISVFIVQKYTQLDKKVFLNFFILYICT